MNRIQMALKHALVVGLLLLGLSMAIPSASAGCHPTCEIGHDHFEARSLSLLAGLVGGLPLIVALVPGTRRSG